MAPLHPFPAPSIPPSPTLPILLPPLALLTILLILYIRRPPTIIPTRPMATIKTPLLAGTTARTRIRGARGASYHRVGSYGGIGNGGGEEGLVGGGGGRGRGGKRPGLVRRDEDGSVVDTTTSTPKVSEEEQGQHQERRKSTRLNSLPTLVGHEQGENDSSDDQGPSTPDEAVAPIHFRSVVENHEQQRRVESVADGLKGSKGAVEICEREVVETPVEERMVGGMSGVAVVCA